MVANRKVTGTASSIPGGLALGWAISMGVTLLGSVLLGHLISGEMVKETAIGYGAMLILLASSVVGAGIAVKKIKHRKLFVSILSGTAYYGTLLAITALFFGGQYQGMGVTALMVMAGCGIVILLSMRQGRGTRPGGRNRNRR